jgi:carbon monoxide dehydrogenase subunit G
MAMELDHSFTVPVPPDQAWDVLLDVARIAPCMPGATVETVEGDDVAGRLKVKVGPVSLTYKGTAKFTDRDPAGHSVLVEASGKETRGAGTASATVRAALRPSSGADSDGGTLVTLHTTLNVTGRPAQFGRGVIAEVGSRLIDKFADNLAQQLTGTGASVPPAPAEAAASPGAPETARAGTAEPPQAATPSAQASAAAAAPSATVRPEAARPAPVQPADDHLDLLSIAGPVIVKRLAPVVGAAAAVALLTWTARRIFRRRKSA